MNVGNWGIICLLYSYYHISHKTPWSVSILLVYDTFVLSAKARLLYFFFLTIGLVSVFLQITANRNKLFLTSIYCSILPNKAGCELLFQEQGVGVGGGKEPPFPFSVSLNRFKCNSGMGKSEETPIKRDL